jgi:hypothetical protein
MATDCAMAKRAEKKAQASRDKESGLAGDKAQSRDKLRAQVVDVEKEFVRSVATAQGWDEGS